MLPAPLASNRGLLSSSSSFGVSRSSEDQSLLSDAHSGYHQRLVSPQHDSYSGSDPTDTPPARYHHYESSQRPVASPQLSDSHNPFRGSPAIYDEPAGYISEPEAASPVSPARGSSSRGVKLTDSGPVIGPEGVRRVSRPSKRPTSNQAPPQNRYSRGSMYSLPPGAAPPQNGGHCGD